MSDYTNTLDDLRRGLTGTISELFSSNPDVVFTTHDIREHLERTGFNLLQFSRMRVKGRITSGFIKGKGHTSWMEHEFDDI